jgi:hypothetical protein
MKPQDQQIKLDSQSSQMNTVPSLESVLALDNPWCLRDVLKKLIEASEILLQQKDYDGHGWEEISHCVDRGNEIVSILSGNASSDANDK